MIMQKKKRKKTFIDPTVEKFARIMQCGYHLAIQ